MSDLITFLTNLFSFDQEHPLLFTQLNFWVFFLLVYAGFCAIMVWRDRSNPAPDGTLPPARRVARNGYLFAVSLFFYYKTSGLFVLLLIFSTFLGHLLGIRMDHLADRQRPAAHLRRKTLMIVGVVLNLFMLCYFKYAYFFTDIYNTTFSTDLQVVNHLAQWANHFTDTPRFNAELIVLPVGISFFTFQNISYIVDVYKQKIRHVGNVFDFGFYTTFFPQLVAGPIIRADQFVPQLYRPLHLSKRYFGLALFWIINGLVKKIVLSDYLAVNFVDRVFDNPTLYTPFENLSALLVYSLQVYADFSGYTDIAIGVALLMGFRLPTNFNSPYKAANPADFWHRWHMSLSTWLRDYLYIPLGGNRNATPASRIILGSILLIVALMAHNVWVWLTVALVAAALVAVYVLFPSHRRDFNTNVNNMDTMLLGGLWHGASFNFITWGGLNGVGILAYKWWRKAETWPRLLIAGFLFVVCAVVSLCSNSPLFNLLSVLTGVFFAGVVVRSAIIVVRRGQPVAWLDRGWNVLLTFVFISFTRLFFRSGSNLNPAEANEVAWNTARSMVGQIGSHWHLDQIPAILSNYATVFILFAIGMVVHWLPARWKRRYRLLFASLPLWMLAVAVVAAVFLVYQFVTADLQPFIYFQF
ncbi:MAG: MBOAT family protein [Bacteroidales bacterium]|nr:MBOAT family protein [Bacteroidales bacterium]